MLRSSRSFWREVLLYAIVAFGIAGCGGSTDPTPPPPPPPVLPPPPPTPIPIIVSLRVSVTPDSGFAPLESEISMNVSGTAVGPIRYRLDIDGNGIFEIDTVSSNTTHDTRISFQPGVYNMLAVVDRQGVSDTQNARLVSKAVPLIDFRTSEDRPDDHDNQQVHFIYVTCQDCIDRGLDTTGVIEGSVSSFQAWLAGKIGRILPLDTYQGRLDISYFKSTKTREELSQSGVSTLVLLANEIVTQGFNRSNKKYMMIYDGPSHSGCGGAFAGSTFGAMYLQMVTNSYSCASQELTGDPSKPPGYWEFAILHDIVHMLGKGYVEAGAPNHDNIIIWHTKDSCNDLMYGGGLDCGWSPTIVDIGQDDYYGENVPDGLQNLLVEAWLVQAPMAIMALAQAQETRVVQQVFPVHKHEIILPPEN